MPHTPVIFVNLPVTSLKTAEPFYEALGFYKNPNWSTDDVSSFVLSQSIAVMLMEHERFQSFMPASKSLICGRNGTETLLCISVETKEDVDKLIEELEKKGGKKDPTTLPDMPGMYGRSVEDPDGHIWEVSWMEGLENGMPKE
ncbi:Glyoxalase/bleomycin resistance protein/dioxygenase [Paraphoma chrysanthemicola]|uniref:Glyoxalase/bleomycin resistance protein/dioxygenase n=1 Tax=Paraphoma chrysanthemicola TaxID=798071 RepID=A0A8K0QRX7_9PLEO|nr:Glyoxalase/bleomycin resistance protein/dioxygenase [Paraphoma chrysanthemicola]